jgi:prepilin-type processing-associated H-X9-DG protein
MGNYLDQFKGAWDTMEKNRHKVSEPFLCPVQDPQVFVQVNPYYTPKGKVPLISQFIVNYSSPDNKFKQLSKAVMVADVKKSSTVFLYTYYSFTKMLSWLDPRHSKKSNTGFFDGSVRAEQYFEEKFLTFNLTKTGKGMIHSGPAESL